MDPHKIGYVGFKPLSEEDKLNCAKLMVPASTYAVPPTTSRCITSECNKVLDFCEIPMYNHREGMMSLCTILSSKISWMIAKISFLLHQIVVLPWPYAMQCLSITTRKKIAKMLYFKFWSNIPTKSIPGESRCDIVVDRRSYFELKNEVGAKGAESLSEATSYWANEISTNLSKRCPVPGFLVEALNHLWSSVLQCLLCGQISTSFVVSPSNSKARSNDGDRKGVGSFKRVNLCFR